MKKQISVILVFFLTVLLSLMASAVETDGDEEGFSFEELPEYGDTDILIFPEDDLSAVELPSSQPPDPTAVPTSATGETETKEHDPEQPAPEDPTEEGESDAVAPSPAPEEEPEPSKQHNLPVVIIAAALALGALVYLIVKKPKAAKRNDR